MQITKNFHRDEFKCRCKERGLNADNSWCHGVSWVHRELVVRLQGLRDHFNAPITVSSGCRCPRYNTYIGSTAPLSQHIRGTGADIIVQGRSQPRLRKRPEKWGFSLSSTPSGASVMLVFVRTF